MLSLKPATAAVFAFCLLFGASVPRTAAACSPVDKLSFQLYPSPDGQALFPTNAAPIFQGERPVALGLFDADGRPLAYELSRLGLVPVNFEDEALGFAGDTVFTESVFQIIPSEALAPNAEYQLVALFDESAETSTTTPLSTTLEEFNTGDGGVLLSADGGQINSLMLADAGVIGTPVRLSQRFRTSAGADVDAPSAASASWLAYYYFEESGDVSCRDHQRICISGLPIQPPPSILDGGTSASDAASDIALDAGTLTGIADQSLGQLVTLTFEGADNTETRTLFIRRDTLFMPSGGEHELVKAELVAIDAAGNRSNAVVIGRSDIPHNFISKNADLPSICESLPTSENWNARDAGAPAASDASTRDAAAMSGSTPDASPDASSPLPTDGGLGNADARAVTDQGMDTEGTQSPNSNPPVSMNNTPNYADGGPPTGPLLNGGCGCRIGEPTPMGGRQGLSWLALGVMLLGVGWRRGAGKQQFLNVNENAMKCCSSQSGTTVRQSTRTSEV